MPTSSAQARVQLHASDSNIVRVPCDAAALEFIAVINCSKLLKGSEWYALLCCAACVMTVHTCVS